MKKALIIIILLILIGTLGIVGYNLLDGKVAAGTKTLTSDDNKYSMEIPSSWNVTDKASSIGLFAAENRTQTMYATLSVNTYTADGITLEDYISYGKENYAGNMLYIQSDNQIIMINLVTGEKKMIHSDN